MGRKLEDARRDLHILAEQGKVAGFLGNSTNSAKLGALVEFIRDSIMEYQVYIYNPAISSTFDAPARPQYSKTCTTRFVGSL